MNKGQKSIMFLVFFLFPVALYSQTNEGEKPLVEIITLIQEKHDYHFTYANDVIQGILVKNIPENLDIEETINFLKKETNLNFQFLENNFVAIYPKDSSFFICGYIRDSETKLPLSAATISGKNNHTISDSTGYFKLKVEQKDENLLIRYLGYRSLSKPANYFNQKKCSNLFLISQSYILSEVILTHFITKGLDKMADGSFTINFKYFGILPGLIETDVLQTVQALPGIQSVNETVSTINIRGGTNDQNLLLWDGIRMYQSGHFFGLISAFNPLITTDVSVIKNGTNAEYTCGVSGTIAMKTNNKINNKITGSIGSNFTNIDGFVDIPLGKKSSVQLGARKAISEFVETPTYTKYFDRVLQNTEVGSNSTDVINSDILFDFNDFSMRWLYNISDKDQIRINFITINNELVFNENAIVDQIDVAKESSLIQNSIAGGIYYKRDWNSKLASTFQIYETDYKLKAINYNILQRQQLLQENKVSETSIKLSVTYKYNRQFSFLNGYQFTENGITNLTDIDSPKFKQFIREVVREHGLFSQMKYTSNSKKTNMKVGVRYSYIEKFEKHILEPRISINYKVFKHFNIQAQGELKHQNTSQIINYQNDFLGIEKRRWRLANNENIPVITSKQASVGLNYSNKGWLVSVEGYYKNVDGITSQSQGFLNQYIYKKVIGSYKVNGIEFLINKRNNKISTWLSYTFADNKYTFSDSQEIRFPNNIDITHAVTFGSSYSTGDFKVSAGFNWFAGKPTTEPVSGNEIIEGEINYEAANSSNLENYLRIDFSATYNFTLYKNIKANVGASVWNSFNKKNTLYNFYRVDNNRPVQIKQTSLGLTPNLTFRVKF